jgi:hypothetical protein
VDTGANVSGLALTDAGLTHGLATGPGAAGVIEAQFGTDVQMLGIRVRFAAPAGGKTSGAAGLVAFQNSVVDATESGEPPPAFGINLAAYPDHWEVSLGDGEEDTLGSDSYAAPDGPVTFQVVRDYDKVYVIDPSGHTSVFQDPRIAALAGPWAAWGLTEEGTHQLPAVIESVWGG